MSQQVIVTRVFGQIRRPHATYAITHVENLNPMQTIAVKTLQANGYRFMDAANGYESFGSEEVNPGERIFRFSDPYGADWVFMREEELYAEADLYKRPTSTRRSSRSQFVTP
jgi:hypothetical protein